MDDLETLALMLRPAGGGVHTVSTGKAAQLELQRRLYGASDAADVASRRENGVPKAWWGMGSGDIIFPIGQQGTGEPAFESPVLPVLLRTTTAAAAPRATSGSASAASARHVVAAFDRRQPATS